MEIRIEKLSVQHGKKSYAWRNNPKIWEFTVNKPNKFVTWKIEKEWLEKVLARNTERRFAILVDNNYIGNSYLTNIENESGIFHIFIGETAYWGMGIGKKVTILVLNFAFTELKLRKVKLKVKSNHQKAIRLYSNIGFEEVAREATLVNMEISMERFNKRHLV